MSVKDIIEELNYIASRILELCRQDSCDTYVGNALIERSQYLRTVLKEKENAK